MEPWFKVVTPRQEVRQGRSFNPDEFAIALEQVVAGTAPQDYRDPQQFFSRTCFTRAFTEHTAMVLSRLAGNTENTAPVLTLVTQFGGGKTHTLTALYHLARNGPAAARFEGVPGLLRAAGLQTVPQAKVAVFVGNAWDPQEGLETPWLDVANRLAGAAGKEALGPAAREVPPGTEALGRVFRAADAPVLVLFDEVLNFVNRHRGLAEGFYAFIQNLTVAMTGTTHGAAVISLPRSRTEMTDWDLQWQERITKVVRRVAKDLIANDESEIAEVVRRRLFEDLGSERTRKNVARAYADWCFERRAQLPPEWTAVDTSTSETKARDYLMGRFEACYPFHPATLAVFQRKWQPLPQYQQTRGTLAMLAQWVSLAARDGYQSARREPLITLGSAPLVTQSFRAVVLGQLGEARLATAIETDVAGAQAHSRVLDADTKGPLREIHQRVGAAILFECSGGQADKVAHLPELRFALGEPEIDTTSVDNAAFALEARAFFTRKVGTDGFRIGYQPTLKKVVSDRRASLDDDEVKTEMRKLVEREFERGRTVPIVVPPSDDTTVQDAPKLALVVMGPETEWTGNDGLRQQLAQWTKQRGAASRSYPAALVWCLKKPGRDFRDKVEIWLAWRRVAKEAKEGTLGEVADRAEVDAKLAEADSDAKDEVWGGYRYVAMADRQEPDGLKVLDLGAGHSSATDTLCGRVIAALKSNGLLSEAIGAGYLERNWPPALKESGAWPLSGLRQSFLNGTLTRLLDPDSILKRKIVEFVGQGDFGLASGAQSDGTYMRVWYGEPVPPDEITFEAGVFLLTAARAKALKGGAPPITAAGPISQRSPSQPEEAPVQPQPTPGAVAPQIKTLRLTGAIPPEVWNRLGTKLIPKLRAGKGLTVRVEFDVAVEATLSSSIMTELRQALADLGLANEVAIQEIQPSPETGGREARPL